LEVDLYSTNLRELWAIAVGAASMGRLWAHHVVHLLCDNTCAVFALANGGSDNDLLRALVWAINSYQVLYRFTLVVTWRAGADNVDADRVSRGMLPNHLDSSTASTPAPPWLECPTAEPARAPFSGGSDQLCTTRTAVYTRQQLLWGHGTHFELSGEEVLSSLRLWALASNAFPRMAASLPFM
jgi:hypothetical protein